MGSLWIVRAVVIAIALSIGAALLMLEPASSSSQADSLAVVFTNWELR